MKNFTDPIDAREKLEKLLESLEPELPKGVRFVGPTFRGSDRTSIDAEGPQIKLPIPSDVLPTHHGTGLR